MNDARGDDVTEHLPLLPEATVDAAVQGNYCPKLCTFACPVHQATGRDDAVPWSFHRAVTDLDEGRRAPDAVRDDLVACTGCLACRQPCDFDQDVPAQVRDARAVAAPSTPAAGRAVQRLADGQRPDGTPGHGPDRVPDDATVLHAGCHDPADVVAAAGDLLTAAGHDVTVVADGCCGQLATDLGATEVAADRAAHRQRQLRPARVVVTLDPHCLPALPDGVEVADLWSLLAAAPPVFTSAAGPVVAYHDPCVLARGAGVVDPPRQLVRAAGCTLVEPEHAGTATGCSGAGMGLPLLDPGAADATAARRANELAATRVPAVTACSRAADRLRGAGIDVDDLAVLLAARLAEPT